MTKSRSILCSCLPLVAAAGWLFAGTAAALMLKQGLASGQVGPALQDTLRRDGAELG